MAYMLTPLVLIVVYVTILVFYSISLIYAAHLDKFMIGSKNIPQFFKERGPFMFNFFTIWNFLLQIVFLVVAITDDALKGLSIKSYFGNIRQTLFVSLMLPSSLLVVSMFWGIWMVDRELIFPIAIDEFYPSWLNHTMHTFIVLPVFIELWSQSGRPPLKHSIKNRAFAIMATYCFIYQLMYFCIYFFHGIWLYPIYLVLSWPQRMVLITFQFALCAIYQKLGIALLSMREIKTN
ncbi:androgen-dependent TFPI-regulating protein-like isoform X1 [Euwallacea fornicatus]|uniref:androgen-dependent TFPI-regulating protein-like isoform X1 n=1 Tax=Euwallacea fornicatus TaxID=995702 RepID=UPI00339072A9